mgnify:CR=1 FL=1
MKNNILKLVSVTAVSSVLVSCGTIGGIGKDLKYLGGKMEASGNRRLFKSDAQSAESNASNDYTYTETAPVEAAPAVPNYPTYPAYPDAIQ